MSEKNIHILQAEFDRQLEVLIKKGYPAVSGVTEKKFLEYITPLRDNLNHLTLSPETKDGYVPFVIVVTSEVVSTDLTMPLVERSGKNGIVKLFPLAPSDFHIIEKIMIPHGPAYLLIDIDRGAKTLNIRPNEAFSIIEDQHRSPLTIDEGVAILTQYPEFLKKNNCFSLLASRHTGDKRVPAIWINANKEPNLGWCWDGNPHTWLGSASCGARIGI